MRRILGRGPSRRGVRGHSGREGRDDLISSRFRAPQEHAAAENAQARSSALLPAALDSQAMKPATHSFYADAVQRVIEHVASHLDEALELDTMAAQACLSRFHFHRVF